MYKLINSQLFKYIVVGVFNTSFSYSVYALFLFFGLSYKSANFVSLVFGILFSYMTQGKIVFGNATPITFAKFVLAWVFIYFGNITIIELFMNFKMNAYLAGAIALIPVTFVSYFVLKFFVFARK